MKYYCAKCNKHADGETHVEGGISFTFCKYCSEKIEDRTGGVVSDFIGPEKKESHVAKNMREARERRAKGIKIW